ncbi:MFS sugar transporter-like protein [Mytilinidion resinicola]|uniref:MFS sugar transporter-like protein n=1 Tax=Mytilinidion resinicola TaxID=574789 RepID=A0A6A6YBM4_9PEZI|nr:MFS sugar transporter-like protein [Mytilinidion resinicola]KAF2805913.1 MFS sugar transporter-like protein [Mytilinidion resinicola]
MKATTLGKIRAFWLGSVVCMGGFLFGYDSGIVGGVLTLSSYHDDFRYSNKHKTCVNSLSVGLQQAGAFAAYFVIWPITNRLGRKKSLMLSSAVFCVGAIIQTINTHSLAALYVGRIVTGIGLGTASVVIGSLFQWFYTFGIFTSYWIDYAMTKRVTPVTKQWQIPIGLQLVPAAMLGIGMLTLKESTRWLTKKSRHEEAWESLKWIRADESLVIELLEPDNFKRIFTSFAVFTAQQATGATAFAYFGPQYFKLLVGGGDKDLLLTAIFGAIKVVACGIFVLFLSERIGRRQVLICGAAFIAACQISCAAIVKNKPAPENGNVTSSGIATVALIYMFVIAYNLSWGPLPWPYVSEIFPTRIREPGIAVGVSSQWLVNFVFSLTTPYMIDSLGWGTFLFWGLADTVIAIGTFFFLHETKGLSLEEIAHKNFGKASNFKDIEAEHVDVK